MKIKTQHVPLECDCLTNGKEYEVTKYNSINFTGYIADDDGDTLFVVFDGCAHLNGKAWEVIQDD